MGDFGPSSFSSSPLPLRLLTHNIRYATPSPFKGEVLWHPQRARTFLSHLHFHSQPYTPPSTAPLIICLQEVLHVQLLDVISSLGQTWDFVGVGRDDGATKGEYAPIFYQPRLWRRVHYETFWLNEDGSVGKRGWDAASVRILTCLVLEYDPPCHEAGVGEDVVEKRGRRMLILNTHLDDQGRISRVESAKIILRVSKHLREKYLDTHNGDRYVLAGDLNSQVSGPEDAYGVLSQAGSGFVDSLICVVNDKRGENGKVRVYGETNTFTGFDNRGDGEGLKRIDFVFVGVEEGNYKDGERGGDIKEVEKRKIDKVKGLVQGYAVLPNRFEDEGVYMSDHRAVVVDLLV